MVSAAARGGLRRAALAGGGGRGGHVARPAHPRGDGGDVRARHLQPAVVDHPLPQQPGVSRDRAGAARRRAVRAGAVRGRLAAPPPRPGAARPHRAGLAAVAAALRVRRRLRGLGPEQARRSRLVRRHRHLAAGRAGPGRPPGPAGLGRLAPVRQELPHRVREAHRAHRAVRRGRLVVARHALRGRVGRRRLSRGHRGVGVGAGVLLPRHRRAGDLGGAVHARSGDPGRSGRQGPAAPGRAGPWTPGGAGGAVGLRST